MPEQSVSNLSENNNDPPQIYRIKQYQPDSLLSQFSYMLVRPPRFLYNQKLLNPPQQYQKVFKVQEHQIPFKLTLYKVQNMMYVILYLHGNSSSRFQGYMHLRELPERVGLACFDFSGCGMRFESQFITLGVKQSKQVDIAARYLKNLGHKVVGWGRSMGSVSLLLSQQCDVMVADSPFSSLTDLCKQSTKGFMPKYCCCLFYCLYPCLFACVKADVEKRAGFDLKQLEVMKIIQGNPKNKNRSLFIMAGTEDSMIHHSHSRKIYDCFPGNKHIQLFQGSHNSTRPDDVITKCFNFIEKQLGIIRKKPKIQPLSKKQFQMLQKIEKKYTLSLQKTKVSVGKIETTQTKLEEQNTLDNLNQQLKSLKQKGNEDCNQPKQKSQKTIQTIELVSIEKLSPLKSKQKSKQKQSPLKSPLKNPLKQQQKIQPSKQQKQQQKIIVEQITKQLDETPQKQQRKQQPNTFTAGTEDNLTSNP